MAERDPELLHQIVLRIVNGSTTVSCNCRRVMGKHVRNSGQDSDYYEPMPIATGETIFDAYNRRENHWTEFYSEWMIRT